MSTSIELGRYLASLRDRAGLKQNELAHKVTWSPAVLSRVESGERAVSTEELHCILEAIGTDEARQFQETAGRAWRITEKPPLGHPDEPLLWEAELALQSIEELRARPEIKNVFVQRLEAFRQELNSAALLVLGTEHSVAFVGDIGVGKSTAICRVADLEVQKENTLVSVLEVGGGGVTICDVHLVQGPRHGFIIEPMGENELRREVLEFAHYLKPSPGTHQEEESADPDFHGTSREIERAIRNMSGLTRKSRRETKPNGKQARVTVDPARELAKECADSNALAVEILTRMALQRRTKRELWHSETSNEQPLLWLRRNYEQLNNGRHPEFSIPRRIEMTVPRPILGEELLSIRIVDTKGIDRSAERKDVEEHFNAPNTIVVLCSSFNSAPSPSVQQLLERAEKGRTSNLQTKAVVLALPRPSEALAVKDDAGVSAETTEEGYELKEDQVQLRLEALNVPDLPIGFFNALEDSPKLQREFLLGLVDRLRTRHRAGLQEAIEGANDLVRNFEKTQVQEIQRQAASHLVVWRKNNQGIGPLSKHLQDSLVSAINRAHASSLRASVRRQGEWYNLDYSHQLAYGARAVAASAVASKLEGFNTVARNLLQNPELEEAFGLVRQARHILESGVDDLLEKSEQLGTTIHAGYMKSDGNLWASCNREWGRGSGYRDRVSSHHTDWFSDDSDSIKVQALQALSELIDVEWQRTLERLEAILDVNGSGM